MSNLATQRKEARKAFDALMPLHSELLARFLTRTSSTNRKLRVHRANANFAPVCGGGRGGLTYKQWQEDIGPCNCKRCQQIKKVKAV